MLRADFVANDEHNKKEKKEEQEYKEAEIDRIKHEEYGGEDGKHKEEEQDSSEKI